MSISVYSVFTAFLWFNLFILILSFLRRRLGVLLNYQLSPLILVIALSLVRLLVPIEPPFALIVRSNLLLPSVVKVLRTECITIGTSSISLKYAILLFLSLVSAFLMVRYVHNLRVTQAKIDRQKPTSDPFLLSIFQRVKEKNPSGRPCNLYVLDRDNIGPYSFRLKHSAIVLPKWICSFPAEKIYYILQHEWVHLLNNDSLIKIWIEGLCCLLWWNPLVFLLKADLDQALELKCDTKVVKNMTESETVVYGQTLLEVGKYLLNQADKAAKRSDVATVSLLGGFHSRQKDKSKDGDEDSSYFGQRFSFIQNFHENHKRKNLVASVCAACLVLLFLCSFSFTVQPYIIPPSEDLTPTSNTNIFLEVTSETSYLVDNQDETYSLFVNEEYWYDIPVGRISEQPYRSLFVTTK